MLLIFPGKQVKALKMDYFISHFPWTKVIYKFPSRMDILTVIILEFVLQHENVQILKNLMCSIGWTVDQNKLF